MKQRLTEINWSYDLDMPELQREDESMTDERWISFKYRDKELLACVDIELSWSNCVDAGDRDTPPYHWEEIQDTWVTVGEVTDIEGDWFHLGTAEKNIVESELAADLKTEY